MSVTFSLDWAERNQTLNKKLLNDYLIFELESDLTSHSLND